MSDTISPWDKAVPKPDVNQESGKDDASRNIFNPLQLLNEGAKAVKDYGSKIAEQSNKTSELLFPSIYDNKQGAKVGADVKGADAKGTDTKGTDTKGTDAKGTDAKGTDAKGTDAKGTDAKGTNTKGADAKGSDAIDAKVAPKPAEQKAADTPTPAKADQQKPAVEKAPDKAPQERSVLKTKPAEQATSPAETKLVAAHKEIAGKVIDHIVDSKNPVSDLKAALGKLDNLKDATVTSNGRSSHVEVHLKEGKDSAPPNIQQRGFRPVSSHTGTTLNFDLTHHANGVSLSRMSGFSSTVLGPLGNLRHSETTGLFIGKDSSGTPYVNTQSDLHLRRRIVSSSTTLRENQFPADSPMRKLMHQPDALEDVSKSLRMFQDTSDLKKLDIKNNNGNFDVSSEAANAKHVELNFKPKDSLLPLTVKSLDIDKKLSASLVQENDAISLDKIAGLTVNIDLAGMKMSLNPSKVSLVNDAVKMELKNPSDGRVMPLTIPIAKLKEAAQKRK